MELKEQETGVQQPGLQTLKVFKEEVFEYINRDLRIDVLADDCGFTEGPVWNRNENHFFCFQIFQPIAFILFRKMNTGSCT